MKTGYRIGSRIATPTAAAPVFLSVDSAYGKAQAPTRCQARVVLPDGKRAFRDLDAFSQRNIINDFLAQYEKWMGWDSDGGGEDLS
jgi:hypothetical protein